jgi:hypothetical protein
MQSSDQHTALDRHVIKTLLYFDIFHYPLNREEVFRFLGMNSVSQHDVDRSLSGLAAQKILFETKQFYSLETGDKNAERRIKGNLLAEESMPLAFRKAKLIASFPFVRSVMASGSLSKNYMDEKSDLDFFIITAPGRLWIARTLLVLYKRIFLFNSHKHFCTNYFVDEHHLEIEEKNQFTATELTTVIPLFNGALYQKLIAANPWLRDFFPNFKLRETKLENDKIPLVKRFTESILGFVAVPVENLLMKITFQRWKRIYARNYPESDFQVAFKTKKYASKNHPNHYQKRVIEQYVHKMKEFSARHNILLDR